MKVEIQVALNFFISFLYNKLPRRRVNQFGEELEKALKLKFVGHWYPEKPFKGSAFRCLKTTLPLDPVFELAAQESGMAMPDIQENLPEELSIWIDPGEVSYRLGEKGVVKILYSESDNSEDRADREIYRTFNPEAQCFKPIDSVASQLGSMSLSSGSSSSSSPYGNSPSPTYKSSPSPINGNFMPNKVTCPLTFTTATFAQTKFGSTKLKSNGKRSHRMSPTEFSSYIKSRAIIQQQQQQTQVPPPQNIFGQQRPRSLSPSPPLVDNNFLLANLQQQQFQPPTQFSPSPRYDTNGYNIGDIFSSQQEQLLTPNSTSSTNNNNKSPHRMTNSNAALSLFLDKGPFCNTNSSGSTQSAGFKSSAGNGSPTSDGKASAFTSNGIDNFSVGGMNYPNQHLLMAN
ncbi:hypothetical protein JTE90_003034 [Oedothorax gibbosus]|uniref:Anti-proliferative protein domain-containing protein n=1 Tax=Oedothorax gibbosus TaxID=931172 RepID=A0AAV6VCL2_9ARAC|nr:hypothetical protein JTE90_003034 [Oedothorax gibbosus]